VNIFLAQRFLIDNTKILANILPTLSVRDSPQRLTTSYGVGQVAYPSHCEKMQYVTKCFAGPRAWVDFSNYQHSENWYLFVI
jgi:hypothetical protein